MFCYCLGIISVIRYFLLLFSRFLAGDGFSAFGKGPGLFFLKEVFAN